MSETIPTQSCPMAATCQGMIGKPHAGLMLFIPGIVFILLGVLIIVEPRILAWLVAALFVLMGLMMLLMGGFMRKIRASMGG